MDKPTDPEALAALDTWADKIEVAAGVATYAKRLGTDGRRTVVDRDFAKAQADAIRRVLRRAWTSNKGMSK